MNTACGYKFLMGLEMTALCENSLLSLPSFFFYTFMLDGDEEAQVYNLGSLSRWSWVQIKPSN